MFSCVVLSQTLGYLYLIKRILDYLLSQSSIMGTVWTFSGQLLYILHTDIYEVNE